MGWGGLGGGTLGSHDINSTIWCAFINSTATTSRISSSHGRVHPEMTILAMVEKKKQKNETDRRSALFNKGDSKRR